MGEMRKNIGTLGHVRCAMWLKENAERVKEMSLRDIGVLLGEEVEGIEEPVNSRTVGRIFENAGMEVPVPKLKGVIGGKTAQRLQAQDKKIADLETRIAVLESTVDEWDPVLRKMGQYGIADEIREKLGLKKAGNGNGGGANA